jgi:hypothetical protein
VTSVFTEWCKSRPIGTAGEAGLISFAPEVALPAGTPPNAATNAVARAGAEIELVRRRQLDQAALLKNAHKSQ